MTKDVSTTTQILEAAAKGNANATQQLTVAVYDELRALAAKYLQREGPDHGLRPTALVHEAFLKLIDQQQVDWQGRTHFFAIAAQAMRRVLVDHARSRKRQKRGGSRTHVSLDEQLVIHRDRFEDVLAIDELLEQLAEIDARQATIIELRFFGGLTVEEVARALGISKRTVEREWTMARAWLRQQLEEESNNVKAQRYARVKELFLQAVELGERQRAEFLADACGDDQQLRQEVESLLAHHSPETILPADATTVRGRTTSTQLGPQVKKLGPKGQLALGAALCAVLLGLFGWWQRGHVARELRHVLDRRLNALLDAHVQAFHHWARLQREVVESWARDPELRAHVQQLLRVADSDIDDYIAQLRADPAQVAIRTALQTFGGEETEYVIWNNNQEIIAESAENGAGIGKLAKRSIAAQFGYVIRGETVMFVANTADVIRDDYPEGHNVTDVFVATPIYGEDDRIQAVAVVFNIESALLVNTVTAFSKITETSETYAFNKDGLMLSDSRYDEELKKRGILPESAAGSALLVTLHDPGGDLTAGYQPTKSRSSRPLTHMARHAIAGENGQELTGYRNYLGQTVVGVWRWLPDFKVGFALELSREDAYRTVKFVERQFQLSFLLLIASTVGVLGSSYWIARLRRKIGKNQQLGQYTLGDLIGEGGMGRVYRGHHALMKRPCAIKLLKPELMNRQSLARFEREVQLASTLTHPNTIAIYDYGTTPEGIFYYVMEYLEGLDLEQLVATAGPLPWARAVFILQQACGSLREAHRLGMVHRDIKPQNIMLCRLGGEPDFVKVLDFGLAKDVDGGDMNVTAPGILAGTPLYMAPERWRDPSLIDTSSDIFSLGAVTYRLLTANDVFVGNNPASIMQNVLHVHPVRPSERVPATIPEALDQLVMDCLAKDAESRPNIEELLARFEELNADQAWDHHEADEWWSQRG